MIVSENVRTDYKIILEVKEILTSLEKSKKEIDEACKPIIKRIRNFYKLEEENKPKFPWKSVSLEDYDKMYCKQVYNTVFTKEEIKEFIEKEWCHWYNPYKDGRDCTGTWFTSFIYVFPLPKVGKTIVYHFQNCDC